MGKHVYSGESGIGWSMRGSRLTRLLARILSAAAKSNRPPHCKIPIGRLFLLNMFTIIASQKASGADLSPILCRIMLLGKV